MLRLFRLASRRTSFTRLFNSEAANVQPGPVSVLTEEEQMLKDVVSKLATERFKPLVSKMDQSATMDKSVIEACFENGFLFNILDVN